MSTKFRAFQLDSPGSLFTVDKDNYYTLIEARIPKGGIEALQDDLRFHDKTGPDLLHITSWDTDHCCSTDLMQIINKLRPAVIEYPSYDAESEDGRLCQRLIKGYDDIHQPMFDNKRPITREYLRSLTLAERWQPRDILYEPCYDRCNKNDMSLIRLFRSLGFSVLSLGDCEAEDIAERLMVCPIIQEEVDVLILPHHGANNGFITGSFLDIVRPKLAICSANNCNQYDHPDQEIRNLLSARNIPLCTTKRGDVMVFMPYPTSEARVLSLNSDNTRIEKEWSFIPKKQLLQAEVRQTSPAQILNNPIRNNTWIR